MVGGSRDSYRLSAEPPDSALRSPGRRAVQWSPPLPRPRRGNTGIRHRSFRSVPPPPAAHPGTAPRPLSWVGGFRCLDRRPFDAVHSDVHLIWMQRLFSIWPLPLCQGTSSPSTEARGVAVFSCAFMPWTVPTPSAAQSTRLTGWKPPAADARKRHRLDGLLLRGRGSHYLPTVGSGVFSSREGCGSHRGQHRLRRDRARPSVYETIGLRTLARRGVGVSPPSGVGERT